MIVKILDNNVFFIITPENNFYKHPLNFNNNFVNRFIQSKQDWIMLNELKKSQKRFYESF